MFIAEGTKVAREILNSSLKVHKLYATPAWLRQNKDMILATQMTEIIEAPQEELDKISALTTPQEVILVAAIPDEGDSKKILTDVALGVESIRDPGNLGTMIRICDWYGIPQLFCSDDCADAWNPKTIQASMGSISRVEVVYGALAEVIAQNPDHKSFAAILDGKINIHKNMPDGKSLLLIGNESHGISPELQSLCADTISIPRYGEAESLNASIAAAVLIDNLVRTAHTATL